ncbi:MAG: hypothetical protein U0800_16400 [Isosphaeraceae bacterium]
MAQAGTIALMVGPLALYFLLHACWHGGRYPRAIRGSLDYALLAVAIGSLIAFGPIGAALLRMAPRGADMPARVVVLALIWLAGLLLAPASWRRISLYNVPFDRIDAILRETLSEEGDFRRTLQGWEDDRSGLWVRVHRRADLVEIEAHGEMADRLHGRVFEGLRARTGNYPTRSGRGVARVWWALAALTCLAPLLPLLDPSRPGFRAIRAWLPPW